MPDLLPPWLMAASITVAIVVGLVIVTVAIALLIQRRQTAPAEKKDDRPLLDLLEAIIASADPAAKQDDADDLRWSLTYPDGTVLTVFRDVTGWIKVQLEEPYYRLEKQLDGSVSYVVLTHAGRIRYKEADMPEGHAARIKALLGKILPLIPNIDL